MLALIALVVLAPADTPAIGSASEAPDGQICAAMPGVDLAAGAEVTLVRPDGDQAVIFMRVAATSPRCGPLERSLVPGPYYSLGNPDPAPSDDARLWIAFPGRLLTARVDSGAVAIQLGPDLKGARVRSCTSTEGLHLTVWSGTPLTSERLWHQYYYLGYDVDPNCDEREVRGGS